MRHYLDTLHAAQVVTVLQPWHVNIGMRQVKSPKVYVRDSGVLHGLLGVRERRDLDRHPKVGASWEGFLLRQVAEHLGASAEECFFRATHSGAELDLLWIRGRRAAAQGRALSCPSRTFRPVPSGISLRVAPQGPARFV